MKPDTVDHKRLNIPDISSESYGITKSKPKHMPSYYGSYVKLV